MLGKGIGLNMNIVRVLREHHGKQLPIGYVAKILGRDVGEITTAIENLAQEDIAKIEGDDLVPGAGFDRVDY